MVTVFRKVVKLDLKPFRKDTELRVGRPSWDEASQDRWSVKLAFLDQIGRVARSAPEVPVEALPAMVTYAAETGALSKEDVARMIVELRRIIK